MKLPNNKIICGDNQKILQKFPDSSIDLIVTSPPYDDLREYNSYSFSLDTLIPSFYRILKEGGVIVWVINDQVTDGDESGNSFRHALAFKDYGFKLHDTMIYMKNSFANPSSVRCHQVFEYMFVFTKEKLTTFHPIRDRKNLYKRSGKASIRKKDGTLHKGRSVQNEEYGLRFNVWKYKIGNEHSSQDKIAFEHPAIFPEKLARDHIYMWSNPNDIVLDPFCGSGTTCKMAYLMNRKFIGIDISTEYCNIALERLKMCRHQRKPQKYWDHILNPAMKKYQAKNTLQRYTD